MGYPPEVVFPHVRARRASPPKGWPSFESRPLSPADDYRHRSIRSGRDFWDLRAAPARTTFLRPPPRRANRIATAAVVPGADFTLTPATSDVHAGSRCLGDGGACWIDGQAFYRAVTQQTCTYPLSTRDDRGSDQHRKAYLMTPSPGARTRFRRDSVGGNGSPAGTA